MLDYYVKSVSSMSSGVVESVGACVRDIENVMTAVGSACHAMRSYLVSPWPLREWPFIHIITSMHGGTTFGAATFSPPPTVTSIGHSQSQTLLTH